MAPPLLQPPTCWETSPPDIHPLHHLVSPAVSPLGVGGGGDGGGGGVPGDVVGVGGGEGGGGGCYLELCCR